MNRLRTRWELWRFLIREQDALFRAARLKAPAGRRLLFVLAVTLFLGAYELILVLTMLAKPRGENGPWLARLRLYLQHPLLYPRLDGGAANWLDHVRRLAAGTTTFRDDKRDWHALFEAHRVPAPRVYGVIAPGQPLPDPRSLPATDLVIKRAVSGRGRDVFWLRYDPATGTWNGRTGEQLLREFSTKEGRYSEDRVYLITEYVHSVRPPLPGAARAHLRLVTFRVEGTPTLSSAHYLVQFDEAKLQTNHAQGARAIHLDERGRWETEAVPHFSRALAMAERLHAVLPFHSVGWDVLLTERGPCFLEGNLAHTVVPEDHAQFLAILTRYWSASPWALSRAATSPSPSSSPTSRRHPERTPAPSARGLHPGATT